MNLHVFRHVICHGRDKLAYLDVIAKVEYEIGEIIGLGCHPSVMALKAANDTILRAARTVVVHQAKKVWIRLS